MVEWASEPALPLGGLLAIDPLRVGLPGPKTIGGQIHEMVVPSNEWVE